MGPRIFRYVVAHDGGVAPQPFDGYCTLAVCKPQIRKAARVGDWVIGFRGRMPGHVTYVMLVEEVIPIAKYWNDRRFANRRPGQTRTPDNFYRLRPDGQFEQVPNDVHGPGELRKDTGGRNVLVSRRFWYFGNASPRIAPELSHLIQRHRGHAVEINRRSDDLERLQAWLSRWPSGVHGSPVDRGRVERPLTVRRCGERSALRSVKSQRC